MPKMKIGGYVTSPTTTSTPPIADTSGQMLSPGGAAAAADSVRRRGVHRRDVGVADVDDDAGQERRGVAAAKISPTVPSEPSWVRP